MKTADQKTRALAERVRLHFLRVKPDYPIVTAEHAAVLRRAERTLQRWAERECGDGSDWAIERDDATGKPFNVYHGEAANPHRYAIADREAGALRRVAELCDALGLHFYHQTDPRGCMLYVAAEPLTDQNYHNGVACCDD